ncbi:M20 aminoacylase family protein [Lacimonas salitolerans]|uniref:M20 aminoacylase family protein n=1 Tax=Lacimonas salitolerans TaxID=1323750 RepID=A0ABW4EHI2_9RHOB
MTAPALNSRHHNRITDLHPEITAWRRDLHTHPEIGFQEVRTAGIVADKLKEFGVDEIITGMATTGVVGIIKGERDGPMIGLRADMDALPMKEHTDVPWKSVNPGAMHACGHDGHTAMLLGAAKILAETRDFAGSVAVIFQPAEEGGGGGGVMVREGLFDRADCQSVWGLHNWPGMPLGQFCALSGPIMAGIDYFDITIKGQGTHAGLPHKGVDTVLAASHLVTAIQSVPGRNVSPHETATIGVSMFKGSDAYVVMPDEATIGGSVRYFDAATRDMAEARIRSLANGIASGFGAEAIIDYRKNYPPTVNHADETDTAAQVAGALVGTDCVLRESEPCMAGEDFSFMLNVRPGNYIWMGTDQPDRKNAMVHYPDYDFNDAAIPVGVGYWLGLVDQLLAKD